MKVEVRQPAIQVLLRKNVGRTAVAGGTPLSTRYKGATRIMDLTRYIGDRGSVRISKSVREPCGTFSVTLADMIEPGIQDSLYAFIEPMDTIEIYLSSNAYKFQSMGVSNSPSTLPIMMRGFVSVIERKEAMGADGKPVRQVVISGHDYGKILEIFQVFFLPTVPTDVAASISSFPFFAKFGDAMNVQKEGDFINTVFSEIVNPYLSNLSKNADGSTNPSSPLLPFKTDVKTAGAQVSPFGIGGWQGGSIYRLISSFCDIGAWNEFFIEDRADGPYAVYRPNPFLSADKGELILASEGAAMPAVTQVSRADVVSMTSSRSDSNVANYFWVDAPRYSLNYGSTAQAISFQANQPDNPVFMGNNPATGQNATYANNDPTLYGTRKMWEQTQQCGPDETNNGNGSQNGSVRNQNGQSALSWMASRRNQLIEQNKDNVVLESGSMRLKGNEAILAGTYVQLQDGDMQPIYYATSVEHEYLAFGNYFTSVRYERGTGFITRAARAAQLSSPYYSEMIWKQ
ncbi:hypothetical protein [Burkholderia anthina]|uniref:hypothetical protein n=1 Tax=Burkholderia anthina TaxID=179879 RepID=UPI001589E8E3|nr:hypothetical protein [Burkholderia anthina]